MKNNNISSMQDQNQLAQAQQSILHLQNTIEQARSHPNNQVIEQIENSLERAERSLSQAAADTENPQAIDLARSELEQQKQIYKELNIGTQE
ncbi:hypothetical protein [Aquibacillus rhizosphaerae]|uniref:DUF2564 family protein n=1 Tax=Aquibacillus rhizosphaerae TaxID=3051431 RepID=A0ABT7L908_9BACI|nr:hypothetical protein [Aquibacillus sp. LR5S19]MDL4842353.1 hypothetical protein [Aquibacillus sp. LR5S19]